MFNFLLLSVVQKSIKLQKNDLDINTDLAPLRKGKVEVIEKKTDKIKKIKKSCFNGISILTRCKVWVRRKKNLIIFCYLLIVFFKKIYLYKICGIYVY